VMFGVGQASGDEVIAKAPRGNDGRLLCWQSPAPGSTSLPECDAWRAKAVEAAALANAGVGLFVAAGLAAVGAGGYLLWASSGSPRQATRMQLVPVLGTQGGGAMFHGRF
jgi:hypothetical protein